MSTVTLTWTESHSGISQVDTYRIYRQREDEEEFSQIGTFAVLRDFLGVRLNELTYEDEAFVDGYAYEYYVIGHAVQGGDSPPSNIISLPPDPSEGFSLATDTGAPIVTDAGAEIEVLP